MIVIPTMTRRIAQVCLACVLACGLLGPAYAEEASSAQLTLQQQLAKLAAQRKAKDALPPSDQAAATAAASSPTANASAPPDGGWAANPSHGMDSVGHSIDQNAFAGTLRNLMPMTPAQIKTLRSMYNASREASAYGVITPPKPLASSRPVDLSPGATPPVVRLSSGYITSLVFVDATGAPWPVKAYDLGNTKAYNIAWDKKGNTLMVQAITQYKPANLAVMLHGLDTPVMITLIPAQQVVDYRVDMRVPRMGPNAKANMLALPSASSPMLLGVLDGIQPPASAALQVVGGPAQAWLRDGQVFMRTSLTVISPGWVSMVSSADGTHAYMLPRASVILATDHGKTVQLRLKGF